MKIHVINTKHELNSLEHAMLSKIALTITASILTITGITIAIMSGMSLGTGFVDRLVYISIAISASLITQFLPSRKGGGKKWLIFSIAGFVTLLVHMSYFAASTKTSGEVKAANSEVVTRATQRVTDLTAERDSIVSRPVTLVTAELSLEHDYKKRAALKSELSEATRKIKLSERIETLKDELVTTTVTNTYNPLTILVTDVFSVTVQMVTLIHSLAFFVLTEISAAYLWADLLQKKGYTKIVEKMEGDSVAETKSESSVEEFSAPKSHSMQFTATTWNAPDVSPAVGETLVTDAVKQDGIMTMTAMSKRDIQLSKLSEYVRDENCDTTVRAIRLYLHCNMKRAMELARIVKKVSGELR
jgi:hypothetical protein